MNQSGLLYIYTWKIPCVAILNKQKGHFFFLSFAKSEKEGGTSPFWGNSKMAARGRKQKATLL
jgi:hypothetical protein